MNAASLLAWEDDLTVKRKEPSTIRTYRCAVRRFLGFLSENEIPVDKKKESLDALTKWMADLTRAGLESGTIRDYFMALSSYFDWEVRMDRRGGNPIKKALPHLPDPEPDKRDKLSAGQVKKLFDAAEHVRRPWTPELAGVILALMAGSGLRASEVRKLRHVDVDITLAMRIKVRFRKNNADLELPLVRPFLEYHERWWWRRNEISGRHRITPYCLLTFRTPLGKDGIYSLFRQLLEIAGLRDPELVRGEQPAYHPHALRHFAGSAFNRRGGLEATAAFLGHKDLDSARRYATLDTDHGRWLAAAPAALIWPETDRNAPRLWQPQLPLLEGAW